MVNGAAGRGGGGSPPLPQGVVPGGTNTVDNNNTNWIHFPENGHPGFGNNVRGASGVVHNGRMWTLGGFYAVYTPSTQQYYVNDVRYSTDGINWTLMPASNPGD